MELLKVLATINHQELRTGYTTQGSWMFAAKTNKGRRPDHTAGSVNRFTSSERLACPTMTPDYAFREPPRCEKATGKCSHPPLQILHT